MSGTTGGMQAHFRKLHPEAIDVHFYSHELVLFWRQPWVQAETLTFYGNLKTELGLFCLDKMVNEFEQKCRCKPPKIHSSMQPQASSLFLNESHLAELSDHKINFQTEKVLVTRNCLAHIKESGCPPKDIMGVNNLLNSDMFTSLKAH